MKLFTKLTPVAAILLLSLGATSVQAEEKKDPLSISGFIDMSYYATDTDGGESTHDAGLDQVEINVGYDFGNKLTANVDIEYQNADEGVDLEQAFITYALTDNFSVKAGRFLSYSGWETEEPTGLFQYSGTGYAKYFYGYYQQGVSGLYSGDKFAVAVSVVNDLAGPQSTDSEHPGIETMLALMPTDEITIKGFYSKDGDVELINTWASYSKDALTLAVEYNTAEDSAFEGSDASGYLVMANYAITEKVGLTLRYNDWEIEDESGAMFEDATGITISPSYVVNDNLLMVFEYRMDEVNDVDVNSFAVEALITF
ncbi:porin [Colwellia sp. 1_MG-2023]|uniref:porin n=1 Tax=unclassified Colwellia TaxID=196834 RepID=UPI001C08DC33|nr:MULTISPECIES: porin [unclassified Colwellia]MBU2924450.1 porin [Colwellia sp. C2M11]MDO6653110.1 porin [Colwellia sp. 3_MG-2023]MDO6665903.1 porin [Colwellia sp. 2_MG-2023]MDO6690276.1 porin [Colwellia sp. 1_MG-2023]